MNFLYQLSISASQVPRSSLWSRTSIRLKIEHSLATLGGSALGNTTTEMKVSFVVTRSRYSPSATDRRRHLTLRAFDSPGRYIGAVHTFEDIRTPATYVPLKLEPQGNKSKRAKKNKKNKKEKKDWRGVWLQDVDAVRL
ncbi:hypothetical protein CPB83DRAFT_911793 [Crepidotus variabilis]|uniref:Uncharacterized protein n=1 Tax=Crepidotus variabilis TaxID=179855 RepID=A0A9P6E0Z8_9AGAR|nr:hypothetical protein CPB83DRAFT_911793 [Crepidotus variabilis]